MLNFKFLGGCSEIGANSCFININGTNFIVDAGLHPERRDKLAFPDIDSIIDNELEAILITHSHSDHIGALPYLIKKFPKAKIKMTNSTKDLTEIMLADTSKILKSKINLQFDNIDLEYYKSENLSNLYSLIEGCNFKEKLIFNSKLDLDEICVSFHSAGHILGSAGVLIESQGKSIFHTGDVNFSNTTLLKKANFPKHHLDTLIIEATNANSEMPEKNEEIKRFSNFINKITSSNGSLLIPIFSLGKAQEILRLIQSLSKKGSIPNLPIYTHGLTRKINKVYDKYCYSDEFIKKGFEISDIPQEYLDLRDNNSDFLRKPSIVFANGGMVNQHTMSYKLSLEWFKRKNFGIALVGFQAIATPGRSMLESSKNKKFNFGSINIDRKCEIEKYRFSAHSNIENLIEFIMDTTPNNLFIVHGDEESCNKLAYEISIRQKKTRIIIPKLGKNYQIE